MLEYGDFCEYLSSLAVKSILFEVSATPKPGLVDRNNSGAHKDMNFYTFMSSSAVLGSTFYECARQGIYFEHNDMRKLLSNIRPLGIKGENKMAEATFGINTHKGAIFSLGIICAAAAFMYKQKKSITFEHDEICSIVAEMMQGITEMELVKLNKTEGLTYGEQLYKKFGVKGIRGEAESGFLTVRQKGLPILTELIDSGVKDLDAILVQVLLSLMTSTEDSNIIARHDLSTLEYVKQEAREALKLGGMFSREGKDKIIEMDKEFIKRNISPGGSADLLGVTIMIFLLKYHKCF